MGFVIEIAPHTTMEEFYDVFFNQISKQVSGGDHGSGIFIGNNAKISYIHPLTGQSDNFKNRAALSYKSSLSSFLDKGLVAFHSFNRSMATDYATFKLRLHSFSCIFETYCVGISLLLNMQLNGDPDKTHIK